MGSATDRYLASILEQAQDAILSMDGEGHVLSWNHAAERLLGRTAREALGRSASALGSGDWPVELPGLLRAVQASQTTVRRELRLARPDGARLDVEVAAGPVLDGDGRTIGIAAIVRDVDERKRAEQALRESEELHRTTLGNISDAVFITDDHGAFTYICPNVDVIFGHLYHEVEAMSRIDRLLGDDLVDPGRLAAAGEIRNIEHEITTRAGTRRTLLIHLKRVSIGGGTVLHVCRDITERKLAEDELRQRLRFEALIGDLSTRFAGPPDGQVGGAIRTNLRVLGEFLAVDRVALWEGGSDRTSFALTHAWSAEGITPSPPLISLENLHLAAGTLLRGEPLAVSRLAELPAGGVERSFLHSAGVKSILVLPLTIGGVLLGALSFVMLGHEREWSTALVQRLQLIAEMFGSALARERAAAARSAARHELVHASRLAVVGELTATIAHELGQPLSAVLSNASAGLRLIAPTAEPLEEIRSILIDIRSDAVRASEVIARIRALLAKRELEAQPLDVNDLISDVLRLVTPDANLRGLTLETRLAPELPSVTGNRVHLQQVLLNLILNGMDAMIGTPAVRRRLTVSTARDDAHGVAVAVTDAGHGIPPEQLSKIFESFFTTKKEGMGLGLPIARTIVEAHGGRIWAENTPAGGSTFRFTLPPRA